MYVILFINGRKESEVACGRRGVKKVVIIHREEKRLNKIVSIASLHHHWEKMCKGQNPEMLLLARELDASRQSSSAEPWDSNLPLCLLGTERGEHFLQPNPAAYVGAKAPCPTSPPGSATLLGASSGAESSSRGENQP